MGGCKIRTCWLDSANQNETFPNLVAGNYDGCAGTAELGKIAIRSHADLEAGALAPNDRTVKIRLQERTLQASSSGASTVTRISELARQACLRKGASLLERSGF